jgi:hypothetical protein
MAKSRQFDAKFCYITLSMVNLRSSFPFAMCMNGGQDILGRHRELLNANTDGIVNSVGQGCGSGWGRNLRYPFGAEWTRGIIGPGE